MSPFFSAGFFFFIIKHRVFVNAINKNNIEYPSKALSGRSAPGVCVQLLY
jgi:hypothetical protein